MKRKILLCTLLTALTVTVNSSALNIVVNGTPLADADPVIIQNRTFVPVASIAKATDAQVQWDAPSKTVIINKNDTVLKIKIGSKNASKNESTVSLDAPAQIQKGKTFVPLSFIASNLDIPVNFDNATKTVYIGESQAIIQNETSLTQKTDAYPVTKIFDNDTIEINMNGQTKKVRLIGIDAPEKTDERSLEFTKKALEGKTVSLEYDVSETDQYGRTLAYVWVDGKMLNKMLIESGLAMAKTYPPDVKYAEEFAKLQESAINNKLGIWAYTNPPAPSTPVQQPQNTKHVVTNSEKEGVWIKGNSRSMIYHVPSGRDYYKVSANNIVWFETEEQAQAAGYRRAKH